MTSLVAFAGPLPDITADVLPALTSLEISKMPLGGPLPMIRHPGKDGTGLFLMLQGLNLNGYILEFADYLTDFNLLLAQKRSGNRTDSLSIPLTTGQC